MKDLYRGSLVRFCNESPDLLAKTMVKWDRDTEQHRLADSEPAMLWSEKKLKDFINLKWVFFLLMAFLAAEWFLRKRSGAY